VTYRDIDLAMRSAVDCHDWLLAQSVGFRNSAAITCGHLLQHGNTEQRRLTSRANRLLIHFHSSDRRTAQTTGGRLKGFRVTLTGMPHRDRRIDGWTDGRTEKVIKNVKNCKNVLGFSAIVVFRLSYNLQLSWLFILYGAYAYDSNFCFDIWRVTNADYLLTYLLTYGEVQEFLATN